MPILQITIDLPHGGTEMPVPWYEPFALLYLHYPIIAVLLTLIVIDIFTGIAKAFVLREISSTISSKGMYRKCMTMGVVAVAWLFETIAPKVGGYALPWGQVVAFYFCLVEIFSIVENAGKAGVPIPKRFMQEMERLRTREESAKAVVNVNINDGEAIKEAVTETKSAIRQGVHDVRDDLNAASLRAHEDATETRRAIEEHVGLNGDSKVVWDERTNTLTLRDGKPLDLTNPQHKKWSDRYWRRREETRKPA